VIVGPPTAIQTPLPDDGSARRSHLDWRLARSPATVRLEVKLLAALSTTKRIVGDWIEALPMASFYPTEGADKLQQ
jgi:hypothetical protein